MLNNAFMILEAAPAQPQPGSVIQLFLPLILIFGLMYFMTIRPQKKREEALRKQIDSMQVGDKVVTIGGITGRVFNIQDDEITISTSVNNTLMTFKKSAIATVVNPQRIAEAKAAAEEAKEKKDGVLSRFSHKHKTEKDDKE